MKCPCEECITLSVCRHKRLDDLLADCKIVRDLLYYDDGTATRTRSFSKTLVGMRETLQPCRWYCEIENDGHARIWHSHIPYRATSKGK